MRKNDFKPYLANLPPVYPTMRLRRKVFVHLDSGRGYSRDLLRGIYAFNNAVSHWEIVYEPAYFLKSTTARNNLDIVKALKPDGCILEFGENISELAEMSIPIVQVTSAGRYKNIPTVIGDYESDAIMAADYFSRKGFKNIAFFGIEGLVWSDDRQASLEKCAARSSMGFFSFLLKGNESDVLSHDFNELIEWLTQIPKPIGILCCNDDFGQILVNSCSLAGIKVPYEIAVLGIDNDELICNICYPNLSSIARNHQNTANAVCRMLNDMMDGTDHTGEVITTKALEIIERSSTDTIATFDKDVSHAIAYISMNLHRAIDVNAVALHCGVSVKGLNRKFKSATQNTVYEEIQFRKISRFKQLLLANKSVKEIAFELAFQDSSHVSRWFTNLEGISPTEWKRRVS